MRKRRRAPRAGPAVVPGTPGERARERIRELEALNREFQGEILERIRTENLLLTEKAYLDALESSPAVGIVVLDRTGKHTHVNHSFVVMTGYSGEEVRGKGTPYPYWPPDDREINTKRLREILKGAPTPDNGFEMRFRTRDGRILDVAVYPIPYIVHGGLHGHILIIFNTTARKQAEAVLRESEESLRLLLGNFPVGVSIVRNGEVVFANAEQRRILCPDCPESATDFRRWFGRVHPDDAPALQELLHEERSGRSAAREKELRILSPYERDASIDVLWVRARAARIPYRGKDATLLILIDITQTKEFERVFAVQEKLASLGQVSSGIAHEIRNPLSGINLSLAAIEQAVEREGAVMDPESGEKIRIAVGRIRALAARIETTTQRVMGLSRPAPYPVRPVDMNLIVEESVQVALPLLRKGAVTLTRELAADLPPCNADLHLMGHVLGNLIANAVRAMESNHGPRLLEVRSFAKDGQVFLCVSDSGPGVPPRIRERIFEPFFTTNREGHGIGLSISHRIVTEHGGTISVGKSRWGGAQFCIALPAAEDLGMQPRTGEGGS